MLPNPTALAMIEITAWILLSNFLRDSISFGCLDSSSNSATLSANVVRFGRFSLLVEDPLTFDGVESAEDSRLLITRYRLTSYTEKKMASSAMANNETDDWFNSENW